MSAKKRKGIPKGKSSGDVVPRGKRDGKKEREAYFRDVSPEKPLDLHDELVLLDDFPVVAVKSYICCFRFSEEAEIIFVQKAPKDIRLSYINYYGLRLTTQKYVIDENMIDVAKDFLQLRRFDDLDYLLDNGSSEMIRLHLMQYPLNNDEQVLKVLYHSNHSLFNLYVTKERFVSDDVITEIIEKHHFAAFKAICARNYRHFKKYAKKMEFAEIVAKDLPDVMLSEKHQLAVLDEFRRDFLEHMLCTTPLYPKTQELMFKRNFNAEWFKLHVEHLYGVAGYRFEPQFEELLFKKLASKNLDECLLNFRQKDDVSFVRTASPSAVAKYVGQYWLTDEAQVALILRGDAKLIKVFIQRFTPEHGMCWQAEVEMAKICSPDTIKPYIEFHSMCFEALDILHGRWPDLHSYYYTRHAY